MVPESELIYLESLRQMCDYTWDGPAMEKVPESGIIFVHADNIAAFFRRCRKHRYIVVSGNSDFSLHYQAKHHPNTDLLRLSRYMKWQDAAQVRDFYVSLNVGPACNRQTCDARDRYSVKSYCWTHATFPSIPDNIVHWFVSNTNIIDDPRIEWIPYGLSPDKGPPQAESRTKSGLLYVNFQNFTDERLALNQHYATKSWATHVPKNDLPFKDYWQAIADHKFVLCPSGNGLDCYRTYETLYLGSIPVMRRTPFSQNFIDYNLPVLLVDSLFDLTLESLEEEWQKMQTRTYYWLALDPSYWKKRIEQKRSEL